MTATKPRDIGTRTESAVVKYARSNGFPHADRLALHGALDEADVQLCPGVVIEVKGGKRAETASDALITGWLVETEVERRNRGADVAALVLKRKGKGAANAGQWWAHLPGWTYVDLADLVTPGPGIHHAALDGRLPPVRVTVAELVDLLRRAGFGDPLPTRKDTQTPCPG